MSKNKHASLVRLGEYQLDLCTNHVIHGAQTSRLEQRQMHLLLYLVAHAGKTVSRQQLIQQIWSGRVVVDDVVAVAISRIRKAFADQPQTPTYIKTIPGRGYQFVFPACEKAIAAANVYLTGMQSGRVRPIIDTVPAQPFLPASEDFFIAVRTRSFAMAVSTIALLLAVCWFLLAAPDQSIPLEEAEDVTRQALDERFQSALKLRNAFNPADTRVAIAQLQSLLQDAPAYADAYVLMAVAKRDLLTPEPLVLYHALPELKALVNKALSLDSHSSYAHQTMGELLLFLDWDFASAQRHFEIALQLTPANSSVHHSYSLLLLMQGDFKGSHKEVQRARQLNPLQYSVASAAWIFAMQNQNEDAWQETQKLLLLNPDGLQYHRSALRIFESAGHFDKAYPHLRKILSLADYSDATLKELDQVYAKHSMQGVYRWLLKNYSGQRDIGFYSPPLALARFAISAVDYEMAFEYLQQAYQQHQEQLIWLTVDPKYKPIREDPRFLQLVQQVGLPEPVKTTSLNTVM